MGTLNRKIARRYGKAIELNNFKADGSLATGGPEIYDSAGLLPTSGVANGTQAYVTANQKLYIRATGGWYNVATVNTTPTISSVADAGGDSSPFSLASDGSTTTVITITATDSEGFPLTFSAVANSGFNGLATVAQDSSVFTITPKTEAAATTAQGTLTFRASDGVNIASEIATFTLIFKLADSKFTTTLIKASGNNGTNTTLNDASTTNNTIATVGNTTAQAFTPYHPAGYSFEVVGNTDAIAIDSGYFTTNTTWWKSSGFTIEGWVQLTSTDNTAIFDNRSSGTSGFLLNYNNTNTKIAIYANGGWAGTFSTAVPRDGRWHYIALTMSGTSANLYVDGIKDSTTVTVANTATYAYFGKSQNTLGAVQYTPRQSNACEGLYRDFKFTAGVEYTGATMVVPTSRKDSDSNTALFVTMSPFPKDISSNSSTVTVLGTTNRSVANSPIPYDHSAYDVSKHGASVYFPGSTGDYVTLGASTPSYPNFGTGAYTIEMWIWPTADRTAALFVTHAQATASGMYFSQSTNGQVVHGSYIGGGTSGNISGSTNISYGNAYSGANAIKFNSWNHIAISRVSTSANQTRMFVNGQLKNTYTDGSNYSTYTYGPQIGQYAGGTVYPYQGYVSDLRVVKGTAVYTTEFTPPTSPLTAVTNTELLTCNDTANIFNVAGDAAEVVLVGNAKSSTAQTKYASASMYFDGGVTGDAVRVGSTRGTSDSYDLDQFAFSDEPLSIEFWMRTAAPSTTQSALSFIKYNGNGGNNAPYFYIDGSSGRLKYWRDGSDSIQGSVLSADTWYHVSYNRFGGRDALYINGTVQGNTTISNTVFEQGRMVIGQYLNTSNALYTAAFFNGYIEDVRVTKGKIRNVMPTAQTFTADSNTTFLTAHASTIVDGSSNNHSITTGGSPTVYDFGPAPGMKSIYFDGTDDYLYMGTGLFANTDFTIEFWWYPPPDGDAWTRSLDNATMQSHTFIDSRGGTRIQLWHSFPTGYSSSANSTGGYTASYYGNTNSLWWTHVENRWTHYAYQRTNGTLRCYVNGIDQGWSQSVTGNPTNNTTYIGVRYDNTNSETLKGYISNYRISNISRYTGNFTPTTAELTG